MNNVPKYRKKPLIVTAEVLTDACYITTLEGVSEGKKGDYLVTGVDNEQWIVKPKWFKEYYTHVRGNQYQRKPMIVDAVQIHEPELVHAPTGDIKGDPGDYRVTGKKGEHWYVKPDIFEKTYERVNKSMDTNHIQKAIDQIGMDIVTRYLPKGMKLYPCDIHGYFLAHYTEDKPTCPLCIKHDPVAEGTTATQVEHWIDIKNGIDPTKDHDGF
jgi:hypothetical protein